MTAEVRFQNTLKDKDAHVKKLCISLPLPAICRKLNEDYQKTLRRYKALEEEKEWTGVRRPPLINYKDAISIHSMIKQKFRRKEWADYTDVCNLINNIIEINGIINSLLKIDNLDDILNDLNDTLVELIEEKLNSTDNSLSFSDLFNFTFEKYFNTLVVKEIINNNNSDIKDMINVSVINNIMNENIFVEIRDKIFNNVTSDFLDIIIANILNGTICEKILNNYYTREKK